MTMLRLPALFLVACLPWACSSAPRKDLSVQDWLRESAIPLEPEANRFGDLDVQFARARVVGLGEATHGQRECFEWKRRLTMHLVREHGYRVVAYEASSSRARAVDDYIAGRSADPRAAVQGLGMLIWDVVENAELLEELRQWNRGAAPDERVRFIGVDAQDGAAAVARLGALLSADGQAWTPRCTALLAELQPATQQLFSGDRQAFDTLQAEVLALAAELKSAALAAPDSREARAERDLRVREFVAAASMYGTRGGRDQAMAELLLGQLGQLGPEARCVLWAHNAHVTRGALRYLGSEELAMGGHLGAALGQGYYALAFSFGEGEFQANAMGADGSWGFQRYHLSAAPVGSLEHVLGSAVPFDFAIDLRSAPTAPAVQAWLDAGHGQRWFGGYQVPDDCDARTRDAASLLQTFPRAEFDGLIHLARTTAARPIDERRLLSPTPASAAR